MLLPLSLPAATVKPCKGDHVGVALTSEQVRSVLAAHQQWTALGFAEQRPDDRRRANLCGAILTGATLNDTDLRGSNLTWSTLTRADLRRANLSWADLRGAILEQADLSRSILIRAIFRNAMLNRAVLNWDAQLRGADLSIVNMQGADLRGADLSGADLRRANFSRANLSGADLRGAHLRDVSFREANLTGVDLRGADLTNVDLKGADVTGIDLRGASTSGVDLGEAVQGAELDEIPVLGNDSVESVRSLSNKDLQEEPQRGAADSDERRGDSSNVEQVQPAPEQPLPAPSEQGDRDYGVDKPVEYYHLEEFKAK